MANLFVFGIGGSGSRVIRSLTMLLAAGARAGNFDIVPVIIDLDDKNRDTEKAVTALEAYQEIRDEAYANANVTEGFFSSNLIALNKVTGTTQTPEQADDKRFKLQFNTQATLADEIGFNYLIDEDRDLVSLLFDDSPAESDGQPNPDAELYLPLNLGFKGKPSIGSVVFTRLRESEGFTNFMGKFNKGDRIFVVSSIFGGTGSSGFPQLLRILNSEGIDLKKAIKGAATLMPYYDVEDPKRPGKAIDSKSFLAKTKAALSYYTSEILQDIHALYMVVDKPLAVYPYSEGGKDQENNAHLAELIAANAIIDFANTQEDEFNKRKDKTLGYAIRKEEATIDFRHFFNDTQRRIAVPMILFAYFRHLVKHVIPQEEHISSTTSLGSEDGLNLSKEFKQGGDKFYTNIRNFNEGYAMWLEELEENKRCFSPFNLDLGRKGETKVNGFDDILKGGRYKYNYDKLEKLRLRLGKKVDLLKSGRLHDIEKDLRNMGETKDSKKHRFMRMAHDVLKEMYDERLPNEFPGFEQVRN